MSVGLLQDFSGEFEQFGRFEAGFGGFAKAVPKQLSGRR
jgi:hypothetical protein